MTLPFLVRDMPLLGRGLALVLGLLGSSAAADVITPNSVMVDSPEFYLVNNLIDSSGLTPTLTDENVSSVAHGFVSSVQSWVTNSSGSDYYATESAPVLTFSFSTPQSVDGIVYWGYVFNVGGTGNLNEARVFEFLFRDVNGDQIGPVVTRSSDSPTNQGARFFALPPKEGVSTIEVRLTDNYAGYPGGTGGDRVGLGEVRFLSDSAEFTGDYTSDGFFHVSDLAAYRVLQSTEPTSSSLDFNHDGLINNSDWTALLTAFEDGGGNVIEVDTAVDGLPPTQMSLREALDSGSGFLGNYIHFDSSLDGATLNLTSELTVPASLALFIDATDLSEGVIVNGDGSSSERRRVLTIGLGSQVFFHRLTITGGWTSDGTNGGGLGGGIVNPGGELSLVDCIVTNNRTGQGIESDGGYGAGIYNEGTLSLLRCTISNNQTGKGGNVSSSFGFQGGHGAGIYNSENGNLTAVNCTFSENLTGKGGDFSGGSFGGGGAGGDGAGVYCRGTAAYQNCTFAGNENGEGGLGNNTIGLGGSGGGISNELGVSSFIHCTIIANSGYEGGGIFNNASIVIKDSIIANNSASDSASDISSLASGIGVEGTNIVLDISGSGLVPSADILELDPLLGALADNGGQTETAHPLPGSPAIDAAMTSVETFGQRGAPRPIDGDGDGTSLPDIGAVEYARLVVTTSDDEDALEPGNGLSLREAIAQVTTNSYLTAITFDDDLSNKTITLINGEIDISGKGIDVDGTSLFARLTISGNESSRLLNISNSKCNFRGLAFVDGASTGAGGAVMHCSNNETTFVDCLFEGHTSQATGGAIQNEGDGLTLTDCVFQKNFSVAGGGALLNAGVEATIINCAFRGNESSLSGGAVGNSDALAKFENCLFQGNRAQEGGAVANLMESTPLFANCSFQGNASVNSGGAILNDASVSSLLNCVIWENAEGGGSTTLGASISDRSEGASIALNCLVHNWTATGLGDASNLDGTDPLNDPLFVEGISPLAAPSLRGDLRLQLGSPALGAALITSRTTLLDLAGNTREVNLLDLGAYEHQGFVYVAESASGAGDGSSWVNAYPELQDALANVVPGQDVLVAEGTYYPDESGSTDSDDRDATFELLSGVALFGGFPANGGDLSSRDPLNNPTILSGDLAQDDGADFLNITENSFHVVTAERVDSLALLNGFTIEGGSANEGSPGSLANGSGGGLLALGAATPTISHCILQGNFAKFDGGAVRIVFSEPLLSQCSFRNNRSDRYAGAAIMILASPTFSDCLFEGNEAQTDGGAMTIQNRSFPLLEGCVFRGNSASRYGGAYNSREHSRPKVTNSVFQGNRAESGGAVHNSVFASSPTINCSFQGNSATVEGGAIYNYLSSPVLTNCILWDNSENGSTSATGASVFNSTIGGTTSSPTFSHCLVQNWTAVDLGDSSNLDGTTTASHPRFLEAPSPLTAPFTEGSLLLLQGSPGLDVGDNGLIPSHVDIDGRARIQNGIIDLGAHEGASNNIEVLFESDFDGDGFLFGYEQALGTDPDLSDITNSRHLTVPTRDDSGNLSLAFGRGDEDFYSYELYRSTTLAPDSFEKIFEYPVGGPLPFSVAAGVSATTDTGNFLGDFDNFTITDEQPLNTKAFYRLSIRSIAFE